MKGLLLGWMILCFPLATLAATDTPTVPAYKKVFAKNCSCGCEGKIAFQHLPATNKNITRWSEEAILAAYTYGFGNYKSALEQASQYFTREGWQRFATALQQSGNLNIILNNDLIVYAKPNGNAVIEKQYTLNSQKAWDVTMPVTIIYENANHTQKQKLNIHLTIVKAAEDPGIRGLGIEQFSGKVESVSG